jgi:hypothetical protein
MRLDVEYDLLDGAGKRERLLEAYAKPRYY